MTGERNIAESRIAERGYVKLDIVCAVLLLLLLLLLFLMPLVMCRVSSLDSVHGAPAQPLASSKMRSKMRFVGTHYVTTGCAVFLPILYIYIFTGGPAARAGSGIRCLL